MGSDESRFNVELTVRDKVTGQRSQTTTLWWTKSQDGVHKPQPFWREGRAEAESSRGPSAYHPNALPLGHTGWRPSLKPVAALVAEQVCGAGPYPGVANRISHLRTVWTEYNRAWLSPVLSVVTVVGWGEKPWRRGGCGGWGGLYYVLIQIDLR